MSFSLCTAFTSRKSTSAKANASTTALLPAPDYEKLRDSSSSIFSTDESSTEEAMQKAYQARRAREAEEYLYKYGFGGGSTMNARA